MTLPASVLKHRVLAAIRGAFIADAASLGTHWIYDPAEMLKTVQDANAPEFREPPAPKFYSAEEFPGHYGSGMLSPYGEQLLFATEHVASTMGEEFSGAAMSDAMLTWAETFGGRPVCIGIEGYQFWFNCLLLVSIQLQDQLTCFKLFPLQKQK